MVNSFICILYRELNSDDSDRSDDDSDVEDMQPKGVTLFDVNHFDKRKLSIQKCDSGSYTVAYNGDSRIYIKSGVCVGNMTTYETEFSYSIFVKKKEVLELIRSNVETLLGKNRSLKFYKKNEASCATFFQETVLNMERKNVLMYWKMELQS